MQFCGKCVSGFGTNPISLLCTMIKHFSFEDQVIYRWGQPLDKSRDRSNKATREFCTILFFSRILLLSRIFLQRKPSSECLFFVLSTFTQLHHHCCNCSYPFLMYVEFVHYSICHTYTIIVKACTRSGPI